MSETVSAGVWRHDLLLVGTLERIPTSSLKRVPVTPNVRFSPLYLIVISALAPCMSRSDCLTILNTTEI